MDIDPLQLLTPRRKPHGVCAALLPFDEAGVIDWPAFRRLLERIADAGLTPAVNMDTGYVHLLSDAERGAVLRSARETLGGRAFIGGAFVADSPGDAFDGGAYARETDAVQDAGGTPIIFPSYGLAHQPDEAVIANYRQIATRCDAFLAFELGEAFAPFGRIYPLETYRELMAIPQCLGAKHSSLRREPEWRRLALRNAERPDFRVYTGNDLAIDMVAYGSDYLLGLAALAPDAFARRDTLWADGDCGWNGLNDLLQYAGHLAFRTPTPAYKHAVAMVLHARGWLPTPATHPNSPQREAADQVLLTQVAASIDAAMS